MESIFFVADFLKFTIASYLREKLYGLIYLHFLGLSQTICLYLNGTEICPLTVASVFMCVTDQ